MRLLLIAFALILQLGWTASAWAEPEVTVTLDATPSQVSFGGTVRLEVRVHARGGRIQDLRLDDLNKYPELEVISHQTVRPMQFSFGFGSGSGVQVESSLANIYVLHPTRPGAYEFAPAIAKVGGKEYRSEPLRFVVGPGAGAPDVDATDAPPDSPLDGEISGARYDERAFLRTVVEPKEVYIGQQVDVTVYLYTRLRLSPQSVMPGKPSMDGFWVHDDPINSLQAQTVSVMGAHYRAYVLQRSAAFPQRSGELIIGPPKVTFDVGAMSLFDAPERVERTGVPVTVKVKPLPEPGPVDAVVGQYGIGASLDRTTARTGDAVTLRVDVGGVGNVQDVRLSLPPVAGVRTLQPVIRDQQQFDRGKLSGTRTFEWILISESPGEHTVPAIELHYFDPSTGQYGTASTPTLTFTSTGAIAPAQSAIEPVRPPTARSPAIFGPIRMYSALTRGETPVRDTAWYALLLAFPPVLFLLSLLGTALTRRSARRGATATAIQHRLIDSAQSALRANDPRSFYDRIVASLVHALDSRLGEPVSGLPHTELRRKLRASGFDEDLEQRVINELEGADFARFSASGVSEEEMDRCLQRTTAIIERIQHSRRQG
jgi:hypothetical protein